MIMADELDDEELLLTDEVKPGTGEAQDDPPEDQDEDELEVTLGEEPAAPSSERESGLAKHLRAEISRRDKELADLRRAVPQAQKIEVGPEPTLEDCEYDEDKFKARWKEWDSRTEQAQAAESQSEQQQREASEAWQSELRVFETKRAELKTPQAQEAIDTAIASLNAVQQAVIVKAADNAANVLCALGMYPAKLAEIAAITDPLKQAVAIAKLEGTLKVTTRRRAPDPEEIASGSAPIHATDKTLQRLEKEADKTNDRTALIRYKQQLAAKGK